MQILWWILLLFSVLIYVLLAVFVLPSILFEASHVESTLDVGLKNYKGKNGRAILYEPPQYKKYISKYILAEREGKKFFVCRPQNGIYYLDFDVVLFGFDNKAFLTINVREGLQGKKFSQRLELPQETAYVSLIVNCVNDTKLPKLAKTKIRARKAAVFSVASLAIAIVELLVVKLCLAKLFADVFEMDFLRSTYDVIFTLVIGLAVVSVSLTAALYYLRIQNWRSNL